ncbi:hypothetical protein BpHYR1_039744 [Brachionus plicatilis]|uniref:Secreted protein n=1 Tax=Brachionus plicatilis TaxID=10195 RepID=A0A3M7T6J7_BRAPC|nr:hypothetical protein BpHYR1_039744 [Brachionus plicatilis]
MKRIAIFCLFTDLSFSCQHFAVSVKKFTSFNLKQFLEFERLLNSTLECLTTVYDLRHYVNLIIISYSRKPAFSLKNKPKYSII